MKELYLSLVPYQDRLKCLVYDPVKGILSYRENNRLYFIESLGNTFFIHTEGFTASEFHSKEEVLDFIVFGLV